MLPYDIDLEKDVDTKVIRAIETGNRVLYVCATLDKADRERKRIARLFDRCLIPYKEIKSRRRIVTDNGGVARFESNVTLDSLRSSVRGISCDILVLDVGARITNEIAPIACSCKRVYRV